MTVLPAINVEEGDDAGLLARLDAVRNVADRVHLDVCDGTMTPNRTWRDAARWTEFSGGLGLQAHLMVDDPEAIIGDWLDAGATEIVVHIEPLMSAQEEGGAAVVERLRGLRMTCLERDAALIIAGSYLIPARPLLAAKAYSDALLVLGVRPGAAGQEMQDVALDTVRAIREAFEDLPVWFDGGVTAGTLARIEAAGATHAVAASAIFGAEDPEKALAALQSL